MSWGIWIAVLVSAFSQVAAVHWHRDLLQVWQQETSLKLQLTQDNTRLVLEKSALTAPGRIDQIAREQLQMHAPETIRVLQP